jgi:hypothetical protein
MLLRPQLQSAERLVNATGAELRPVRDDVTLPFSPELRLVIALLRGAATSDDRARIDNALGEVIDWERFLAAVKWHRVIGLVHRSLTAHRSERIPEEVRRSIALLAEKKARQSLFAAMQVAKLSRTFAAKGIPLVVLKGIPLSLKLYRDVSVRQSGDIDLLVTRENVAMADGLLAAEGFRRIWPTLDQDPAHLDWFLRHRIHFEYSHPQTGAQVELHWRLWERPELGPPEVAPELWQRFQSNGLDTYVLPDEVLLPYLCVHGAKHAWFRLRWLTDVAEMVRQDSASAQVLLETASRWGAVVPATQALLLCHQLFGTELPVAARKPSWQAHLVTRMALTAIASGAEEQTAAQERHFFRHLRLARVPLSNNPIYMMRELGEQLVSITGGEGLTIGQRIIRLLGWLPRWGVRQVQRLLLQDKS